MSIKGQPFFIKSRPDGRCYQGHLVAADGYVSKTTGQLHCRQCQNIAQKIRYHRKKLLDVNSELAITTPPTNEERHAHHDHNPG